MMSKCADHIKRENAHIVSELKLHAIANALDFRYGQLIIIIIKRIIKLLLHS